VLLYSPGIDPFLEDLAKVPIGYSISGRGTRNTEADCQDMAENERSEDFGGIFMIWSKSAYQGAIRSSAKDLYPIAPIIYHSQPDMKRDHTYLGVMAG